MNDRFIPATGWAALLPCYDPAVAMLTRERRFKSHLLDQAQLAPGMRVLDVGCGSGTLSLEAKRREPGIELKGLDVDPRMLAQAQRKRGAGAIDWIHVAATSIPLATGSVDRIFCSLLMHHLTAKEKQLVAREMARVLAPGGMLLLADYCRPLSRCAQLQFLVVRMLDGWDRTACNAAGRLPQVLQDGGFSAVRETLAHTTLLGTIRCYLAGP